MKRVCVTGYGAIGSIHADIIAIANYTDLYAVCDIDTVHICTPHYLHHEMIVKALDAGKNVVSEKPPESFGSKVKENHPKP